MMAGLLLLLMPVAGQQFTLGRLTVHYEEGQGFVAYDSTGRRLFTVFPYDNGPDYPSEGLFRIIENGKIGFADTSGRVVIPPRYTAVMPFRGGKAAFCVGCEKVREGEHTVWKGGTWGYIDRQGHVLIPAPDGAMPETFPDYTPKTSPDRVTDYRPEIAGPLTEIPEAVPENLDKLLRLFVTFSREAKKDPGEWVDGNVALGAPPREYIPSDAELLLAETGECLSEVLATMPKKKVHQALRRTGIRKKDLAFTRFSFIHVDVMGSGRFFYVDSLEKATLLPTRR